MPYVACLSSDSLDYARPVSDSEAVRTTRCEAAVRRRMRSTIRDEVRQVAADENDREEKRIICEQLAALAPRVVD